MIDSWSTQMTWTPGNWMLPGFGGPSHSSEASEPGDVRALTASVTYNRPLATGNWAPACWGRNHKTVERKSEFLPCGRSCSSGITTTSLGASNSWTKMNCSITSRYSRTADSTDGSTFRIARTHWALRATSSRALADTGLVAISRLPARPYPALLRRTRGIFCSSCALG
jgi:hypothetical protein